MAVEFFVHVSIAVGGAAEISEVVHHFYFFWLMRALDGDECVPVSKLLVFSAMMVRPMLDVQSLIYVTTVRRSCLLIHSTGSNLFSR